MKILIAGFKGDDNSAKILLDHIKKYVMKIFYIWKMILK